MGEMNMGSRAISVRLPDEVLEELEKLAAKQGSKVSDVVRELIIKGLSRQWSGESEVLQRLNTVSAELGELMARAIKASGRAAAYAVLSARYTNETQHYVATQGQTLDAETKTERQAQWDKYAKEVAEKFLKGPFDKL